MVVVVVPVFANSAACCLQKSKGDTFGYRSGIGWGIGGTRRRPLAPLPFPFPFFISFSRPFSRIKEQTKVQLVEAPYQFSAYQPFTA